MKRKIQEQHELKQVYEPEISRSLVTLMHKENVQQQMGDDNKFQQSRTKLDEEIDEMWIPMKKITKRRYIKRRRTINNKLKLTERDYVSKMYG